MRSPIKVGMLVATLALMPVVAQAGTIEGAAIGAGSGLLIAGPPGAVVDGPNIVRTRHRVRDCWIDRYGERRCGRR